LPDVSEIGAKIATIHITNHLVVSLKRIIGRVVNEPQNFVVLIFGPETGNNNSQNESRKSGASKNKKYVPPL